MKAQQTLQEQELDHVLGLLALCAPPAAAEAAWEGQLDLSCPKSYVGWRNGPTSLGTLRIDRSPSKVWQFTWHACYENQWIRSILHLSNLATKNLLRDEHDQLKSAQATTTHLWMDLRPPTKICYWGDTHVSFVFAILTVTNEHPELLTIPTPQCPSLWNHHCWNLFGFRWASFSGRIRMQPDCPWLTVRSSTTAKCWASKFNKLLMPLKWPPCFEPRVMAVSPVTISSSISSRHCKKLSATTRDYILVTMVNKQTYPHIFDHLKD